MYRKILSFFSVCIIALTVVGCNTDMNVQNQNDPDMKRVLTDDDYEGLLGGTFYEFWAAWQKLRPSQSLAVAANELSSSWGSFAMKDSRNEPAIPWNNSINYSYSSQIETPWYNSYRALNSINLVLKKLNSGFSFGTDAISGENKDNRARAFARFVQGLIYGQIALLFDKGFIIDEFTKLDGSVPSLYSYSEVNTVAINSFKKAIELSTEIYTLPNSWINGITATNVDITRWSNHLIARYMVVNARNSQEREAVNWTDVKSYAEKGIRNEGDWLAPEGDNNFWWDGYKMYSTYYIWAKADNKLIGGSEDYNTAIAMGADPTTGTYKGWLSLEPSNRRNFDLYSLDRRVTGDLNNPKSDGKYMIYEDKQRFREARGTYSFSNYRSVRFQYHADNGTGPMPFAIKNEADMLIAEAELRAGNKQAAADMINISRVGIGEMPPVNGGMDDQKLWNALIYEKRMEGHFIYAGGAFADLRGWTDKDDEIIQWVENHWVQLPIPGKELEIILMENYSFGGKSSISGSNKITLQYITNLRKTLIEENIRNKVKINSFDKDF